MFAMYAVKEPAVDNPNNEFPVDATPAKFIRPMDTYTPDSVLPI